jgi:hypothetical protein
MAKLGTSKPTVTATDGGKTLHFVGSGAYSLDFLANGKVKIALDDGKTTLLSAAEWLKVTKLDLGNGASLSLTVDQLGGRAVGGDGRLNIDGVSFIEADDSPLNGAGVGNLETSHNLNDVLGALFAENGVAATLGQLTINGSMADTLKAAWDYLDDAYVAGNNYYNLPLNESFVRLGAVYTDYLAGGGEPLTDVVAKYAENASGAFTRLQSMHDNLLGNLNADVIADRFPQPLRGELLGLVPDAYEARPVFDGNAASYGNARHDAVRAFDYDRGWDRPDYIDRSYNSLIDPLASRDANNNGVDESMFYGNGNPNDDWNVVRHEGAGVELGLKVKHRGGDEYPEGAIGADGVAHYTVLTGPQPGVANRAEWNFDYAATITPAGQDEAISFKLEIDLDPGAGVDFVEIPTDSFTGVPGVQGSQNYAFFGALVDSDPATDGIQPYTFGPGEFNIRLSAFDDGVLVAANQVVVHVVDPPAAAALTPIA